MNVTARFTGLPTYDDFDKSEKLIAIGRLKTSISISKYENNV